MFDLERGQMAFSLRFLATKWKWSPSRVTRFLKRLEIETMIATLATREATQITICNYGGYQFGGDTDETQNDTPTDTPTRHERDKEKESKKVITEELSLGGAAAVSRETDLSDWPADAFDQFWKKYPHKIGKRAAVKAFAPAKQTGVPWARVIFALERYIAEKPPDRAWCNPATWLNGGRWDDEPAALTRSTGPPGRGDNQPSFREIAQNLRSQIETTPTEYHEADQSAAGGGELQFDGPYVHGGPGNR